MEGLVTDFGARFIVGSPHPPANLQAFGRAALQSAAVKGMLRGSSRHRLLQVVPVEALDEANGRFYVAECEAVVYDYARNRTLRARGAPGAARLQVTSDNTQPVPSGEEFQDAVRLVAQSPVWGPLLESGYVRPYEVIPPVLEPLGDEVVERTLFVGLYSRPRRFNRIVAVNMVRREVAGQEVVPRGTRVLGGVCGPDVAFCLRNPRGTPGTARIQWPAPPAEPLWDFVVTRPAASTGLNGSGVDIKNVTYKGERVLRQAHVPVLNVEYAGNACGPFRDWLWDESCFEADGNDIPGAPGIRWCDTPPQTITESHEDGGNFKGVAVYEHADGSLRLLSQTSAGWYRYVSEFRFYPDGRIAPRFRFAGVADTCVCNPHNHHAYWRFDFDILGEKNICDEWSKDQWVPIRRETHRTRQMETELLWRVRHQKKDVGYEIHPGPDDGVGDLFSGPDQFVLQRREKEIDDGHGLIGPPGNAQADLVKFVQAKNNIYKRNLVIWYAAHFIHTQPEAAALHDEEEHDLGPTLVPFNWPGA
jgi:hypothetical protein